MIRENLKVAQSHQKSYADKRRRVLSFEVGDFAYLKASPIRGLCQSLLDFGSQGRSGLSIGATAATIRCA
jgi:hypothetical protein